MHYSSLEMESSRLEGGEVLVAIATLVTEGRVPGKSPTKSPGFHEGPHCLLSKTPEEHNCDVADPLCLKYNKVRAEVLDLWQKGIPLCVEVLLTAGCACKVEVDMGASNACESSDYPGFLLEQWFISITHRRNHDKTVQLPQLLSAVRSQLHFSQISAWLSTQENSLKMSKNNIVYRLTVPGETYEVSQFTSVAVKHDFPITDIGSGMSVQISLLCLPRMSEVPSVKCTTCEPLLSIPFEKIHISSQKHKCFDSCFVDDRIYTPCTLKGKHRCEDYEDIECMKRERFKRMCQFTYEAVPSTSKDRPKLPFASTKFDVKEKKYRPNSEQQTKNSQLELEQSLNDLKPLTKGDILLNAILRSCQSDSHGNERKCDLNCVHNIGQERRRANASESDKNSCDNVSTSDIFSIRNKFNVYVDENCDSPISKIKHKKMRDISNTVDVPKCRARRKKLVDDEDASDTETSFTTRQVEGCDTNRSIKMKELSLGAIDIPSAVEQAKFRKNLDSATSMVFHSRTGLPLTSSPAPLRKGKSSFDFDSSITSVSAIGNALFSLASDDDSESDGSIVSPCSPDSICLPKREPLPAQYYRRRHSNNLLGTFEESVLNGRLEPVSTVHGFTAELGASGSFVPKHLVVPVTVFFYNLGDNEKVSSPYLGHINLGRKGYPVPRSGTVQVTLFNPLGTVVKMFVIMYDLNDMPPHSQTFLRQRTLYMPTNCQDKNLEWGPKWLRYLVHLRFMSSKSGRIYLHSDIRMIIFRKSDLDTATAHGIDMSYELRSFTHLPSNPRYSPRK